MIAVGETLGGRYTIVRPLGEGGMGSVFEARHTGTGRKVAVKVVAGELLKQPSILARFDIEAKAAGVIESRHVAQVLDVGHDQEKGLPFMVMEFLEGEDLQKVEARTPTLPSLLVARLGAHACRGL